MKQPVNIYISYSYKDKQLVDQFVLHLKALQKEIEINIWVDREISSGSDWSLQLDKELNNADLILLMISESFIASEYCYGEEMKKAINLNNLGEAIVVPILLKPCIWTTTPFSNLQALPRDAKPISQYDDKDLVYAEVIQALKRIIMSSEPAEGLEEQSTIELKFNLDYDNFTEKDKDRITKAIGELLGTNYNIKITSVRKGSVKLRIKLERSELETLYNAAIQGQLKDIDLVDAHLLIDSDNYFNEDKSELRPSVFIGSSSEGLEIAETIQLNLDHLCEVTLWSQGLFGLGQGTLESLVNNLKNFDYSILVITPDDLTLSRDELKESPRDNVIFELGLFMGYLGRERTFVVYDRTADIKLPSDLAGVTMATYQPHSTGNLEAALGAPCTKFKKVIKQQGLKKNKSA